MKYLFSLIFALVGSSSFAACPYDYYCLDNPYGAGSPYKADGLMNPYSKNGSRYSNDSWTNPYATNAPKIYDQNGNYKGRLSTNPYEAETLTDVTVVLTAQIVLITLMAQETPILGAI